MVESKKLECSQCEETYIDYKMEHWYDEEMCEVCNEGHSKNSCGFCGEDLDHKGYYCSKDCAKADNTEGI
jgi:hypothetical protein